MAEKLVKRLDIDEPALADRLRLFRIDRADLDRLKKLKPFAEEHMDAIVDEFYEFLLAHAETRAFFPDEATVRQVKKSQRHYFMSLFDDRCDLSYVEERLQVGRAHERIDLPIKWYVAAYRHYLTLVYRRLEAEFESREAFDASYQSLEKRMHFDMSLAIDMYVSAHVDTLERHQAAIRELSTPVIRVHHRVLLLPLVGAIDSHRAQQIMETVLSRVVDEQAKVLILDIAGVAVVDTQVADHLLKTTAAIELLGAATILTGISPQVARTIVELGVDISAMDTRSRLADGIELALQRLGRQIRDAEVPA